MLLLFEFAVSEGVSREIHHLSVVEMIRKYSVQWHHSIHHHHDDALVVPRVHKHPLQDLIQRIR